MTTARAYWGLPLCLALWVAPAWAGGGDAPPADPDAAQVLTIPLSLPPPAAEVPAPGPPGAPPARPTQPPAPGGVSGVPENAAPEMLGDGLPLGVRVFGPNGPVLLPRQRGFKAGDDNSPLPQDRVFLALNAWDNLYGPVNRDAGVRGLDLERDTLGVEKAFLDDSVSFGLRLPLNTVTACSCAPGLGGTHTTVGDLTVLTKLVLWRDEGPGLLGGDLGDLLDELLGGGRTDGAGLRVLSGGLAVTVPTGPDSLFGDSRSAGLHDTTLQPYLATAWREGRWYVQGFAAVDVPTDSNDVLLMYKDMSVRYFLYTSPAPPAALVSALAPVIEGHMTTPLNHRGVLHTTDPAGTPDLFDLTAGVDVQVFDWGAARVGFVRPLTGPRLFDYEVLSQLRLLF